MNESKDGDKRSPGFNFTTSEAKHPVLQSKLSYFECPSEKSRFSPQHPIFRNLCDAVRPCACQRLSYPPRAGKRPIRYQIEKGAVS